MKINYVFDRKELNLDLTLQNLQTTLKNNGGFIDRLLRIPNFNDEPRFFHYSGIVKKTSLYPAFNSSGCSIDDKKAQTKVLGETVERYCQYSYIPKNYLISSYKKIDVNALNPTEVISFSKNQFKTGLFEAFRVSEKDNFRWIEGISLLEKKSKWVPFQLISINYNLKDEKIIRIPITNGASFGTSMAGAACRAIWECIERDAFVISYLNKLPRANIQIDDPDIKSIFSYFKRYNLEVSCFDITSDIKIPVILTILIDRTGIGPALTVGMKCSLDVKSAIIGSIEEATQFRPFIRKELITNKIIVRKDNLNKFEHKLRILYWNNRARLKNLDFLLDTKEQVKLSKIKSFKGDAISNLSKTIEILQEKKLETILVDCTTPNVKKLDFYVVKAIIPSLQPIYLSERHKYLGGRRLYTVSKLLGYTNKDTSESSLNRVPHPF